MRSEDGVQQAGDSTRRNNKAEYQAGWENNCFIRLACTITL